MTTIAYSPRRRRWQHLAAFLSLSLTLANTPAVAQFDLTTGLDLHIEADNYEFQPGSGDSIGFGNVVLRYGDIELRADRIVANSESKDVVAEGNVVLQRGTFVWEGARVQGNLQTRQFNQEEFRSSDPPWYAHGKSAAHNHDGTVCLQHAQLSTCEYLHDGHAHYKLQARQVTYHADGSYTAKHVLVKVGRVPIFYLPRFTGRHQAGRHSMITIKPGYDSKWGPYLSLSRAWAPTEQLQTKFTVDLLSKIGIGIGNDTSYITDRSQTHLLAYYINDSDTPETEPGFNRRFKVVDDRYRLKLKHRSWLRDDLNLRLQVDALSDIDMLENWFSRDYRQQPQALSFLNLAYTQPNYSLALNVRPRVNDFYTVVEQLPELRLDVPRQRLGNTALYYQGSSTAAYLRRAWRDFDRDRPAPVVGQDLQNYDAWRLDSLHMLYWPLQPLADLNLVPRAGLRLTYYSASSDTAVNRNALQNLFQVDDGDNPNSTLPIINYDNRGGSQTRLLTELGLEASSKFFRTWPNVQHQRLHINGLRHVVEPFANYTHIGDPNNNRDNLYFFDAVDRIVKQNFVRVGVRQRLQTRRQQQIHTLATLDTYADFHFDRHDSDRRGGDLGLEASFNPSTALSVWTRILADSSNSGNISHLEAGIRLQPHERLAVALSYLSRDKHSGDTLTSMGSSLQDYFGVHAVGRQFIESDYLRLAMDLVLNTRTSLHVAYEYDFMENQLARQVYEVIRELHCWKASVRIEEQNGDWRAFLMLYLKAFPGVSVDMGW